MSVNQILKSVMAVIMLACLAVNVEQLSIAQSEKDSAGGESGTGSKATGRKKGRRRKPVKRILPPSAGTKLPEIYRVRVTVIDEKRNPVDDAKVWSTVGGEPKKVEGGWQFDIPAASRPMNGSVTFYATKLSAFSRGEKEIALNIDPNPAITIPLTREYVMVRGHVRDEAGRSIAGARVSVVGYEAEAVITKADGGFVLPAHAADGQQVYLHVEAANYKAIDRWHPAGNTQAIIILIRE